MGVDVDEEPRPARRRHVERLVAPAQLGAPRTDHPRVRRPRRRPPDIAQASYAQAPGGPRPAGALGIDFDDVVAVLEREVSWKFERAGFPSTLQREDRAQLGGADNRRS
ncbi:hypothetical protein ACFQX7_10140 [Luedemannella flava]